MRRILPLVAALTVATLATFVAAPPASATATTGIAMNMDVMVSQWNGGGWQGICGPVHIYSGGQPNPINTGTQGCAPRPPSQGFAPVFTVTVQTWFGYPADQTTSVSAWCVTNDTATYPGCYYGHTYIPLGIYWEKRPFGFFARWCGWAAADLQLGLFSATFSGGAMSTVEVNGSCNP